MQGTRSHRVARRPLLPIPARFPGCRYERGEPGLHVPRTIERTAGADGSRRSALDEQRRIADHLDAETARIDALIAKRQRQIELLAQRSSQLVNSALDGHWIRRIDGVPVGIEGWRSVRLGSLAQVQSGLTLDGGRPNDGLSRSYPYLRVANVHDGAVDLGDVKEVTVPTALAARCMLRDGDVLMTEGGDPDKLGRGSVWWAELDPCLHQNHVFAVRTDRLMLHPEFLALVTRTQYARAYFEMTASKTTGIASTSLFEDRLLPRPASHRRRTGPPGHRDQRTA